MPEIALFVEDFAHRQVVEAVIVRLAAESGLGIRLDWRNAVGGHGRVVSEFKRYLRDLERQEGPAPDLIVIATDANCKGLNARTREFRRLQAPTPLIQAIPDPHIERWLLLDGAAFRAVFGHGCDEPDLECSRDRYKQRLVQAMRDAGVQPSLGGIEYAGDIVRHMNFARFIDDLRDRLRTLQP